MLVEKINTCRILHKRVEELADICQLLIVNNGEYITE